MHKKKSMLILNGLLVVVILVVLFLQFYTKEVSIQCSFDSNPFELLEIVKNEFPDIPARKLTVLFVFPELPTISDISSIEKLHLKFGADAATLVVFSKKFKSDKPIKVPHVFLPRLKIVCEDKKSLGEKNFYLILKDGKVKFAEQKLELTELAFMLQKKLNPQLGYADLSVSTEDLKKKVEQRLRQGNLSLEELDNSSERVLTNLDGISKVYFIHAACSACQLRSLFSKLKINQIMSDPKEGKELVIFSVFADSSALKAVAEEKGVNLPVYLDTNDEFGLFSTITNDKDNPLIIDLTEAEETNED